ncbi:MAG TPA: hypothetical protein VED63_06745 [Acidimicrobiales bacterium]|nr:hypothetical protein [Acidimicrobiales bacterium]
MGIARRIAIATATVATALGTLAVVDVGAASATLGPHKAADATGTETCSGLSGSLSFKPALTTSGTSPTTASIAVKLSGCSGGTPSATSGTVTAKTSYTTNNCTKLASPPATQVDTETVKWSPKTINASTTAFSAPSVSVGSDVTITLSKGLTTGSYAGSASTATLTVDSTKAQLLAICEGKKGLSKLVIASGSATVG